MSDGDNENRGNGQPGGQGAPGQGGGRAPLTLKPRGGGQVSAGTVRQQFSHGRTKTVVVETKRRRPDVPGERLAAERPRPAGAPPAQPAAAPSSRPAGEAPRQAQGGGSALNLSQSELAARQRALDVAREADERRTADAARRRSEDEAQRRRESEAAAPPRAA